MKRCINKLIFSLVSIIILYSSYAFTQDGHISGIVYYTDGREQEFYALDVYNKKQMFEDRQFYVHYKNQQRKLKWEHIKELEILHGGILIRNTYSGTGYTLQNAKVKIITRTGVVINTTQNLHWIYVWINDKLTGEEERVRIHFTNSSKVLVRKIEFN